MNSSTDPIIKLLSIPFEHLVGQGCKCEQCSYRQGQTDNQRQAELTSLGPFRRNRFLGGLRWSHL